MEGQQMLLLLLMMTLKSFLLLMILMPILFLSMMNINVGAASVSHAAALLNGNDDGE
jgi:hypothetical protein